MTNKTKPNANQRPPLERKIYIVLTKIQLGRKFKPVNCYGD